MANILGELTWAEKIRQYIRQLFGSRLVEHLEQEKFHQQSMYEAQLADRDLVIAELKNDIIRLQGKFEEYELDPSYFWWLAQRGRPTPPSRDINSVSDVPVSKSWADIQREHYEREERKAAEEKSHGVQDSRRNETVRVEVPG